MSFPTINIRISGVSVSGAIDAGVMPVRIQPSNSDQIGFAEFALQNAGGVYSNVKNSGSPTVEIDINGITKFRGYIERIDPSVSVQGSFIVCQCYDKGQELLNMISPDARQPPPTPAGILTSGDQGVAAPDGIDLVGVVSGVHALSGATVASFMSQFYGVETDPSGSFSGIMLSFKPHISGYTYDTWYKPDGSPDNNVNYWILHNSAKVKRDYAWETLRKLTRGGWAIDSAGLRVPFEVYLGVSGDIHVFTSGSSEFLASGPNGQLSLIYYEAGKSGSENNNCVYITVPHDTTTVKNKIHGWFPKWSSLPVDKDSFTDLFAYSGSRWSGVVNSPDTVALSGFWSAISGIGYISIMALGTTAALDTPPASNEVSLMGTIRSGTLNISRYAGFGSPVSLKYDMFINTDNLPLEQVQRYTKLRKFVALYDVNGSGIMKSGDSSPNAIRQFSGFAQIEDIIYNADNTFFAGTGQDGGWAGSGDLSQVKRIEIGFGSFVPGLGAMKQKNVAIDNLHFTFNYQFSPVVVFNSGSQGMYKRRYEALEYSMSVSDIQASGILSAELQSRMGSKQIGEAQVKNNDIQLGINNGQVIRVDAPTLNTGSGLRFDYWRIIAIDHNYSTANGFTTNIRFVPWYSGTLVDPDSNLIEYTLPFRSPPRPPPGIQPLPGFLFWNANLRRDILQWGQTKINLTPTDSA